MPNRLVKALVEGEEVILTALSDANLIEEARRIHDTFPTATAALGRVLNAALLLSASLKDRQKVCVQVSGDGPLGEIFAEADSSSRVRGYVKRPHVHLDLKNGKLDVGGAVGKGFLNIIKDLGLREPYRGTVDLLTGEIAEDLAFYLNASEQVPSAVSLGVFVEKDYTVKAAGGFMINALPGVREEFITYIEDRLKTVRPVSSMILDGAGPKEIIREAAGVPVRFIESREVSYFCPCTRERVMDVLTVLGEKELKEISERNETVDITCRFCKEEYLITPEELKPLVETEEYARREAGEGA